MINAIDHARAKKKFLLLGYVIMPEHVHFLIVPKQGETISNTIRAIKWYTSIQLLSALRNRGMEEKRLWQPRFYDFNIVSVRKLNEKLEYCHKNPVTRNLVQSPGEWLHSSYRNYEINDDQVIRVDRWWDFWQDSWM
jgi:putative transposase